MNILESYVKNLLPAMCRKKKGAMCRTAHESRPKTAFDLPEMSGSKRIG
jgi:hypothetical protein